MEYLVIDLRNNDGGYDEITNALCDLFATEDLDHYAVGTRKNGNYKSTAIHCIHGDGEFAYLKVVVLTNFGCLSEGGGHIYVGFPVGLVLDGNGDHNIDTPADRISRNPVQEHIPLFYDVAMKLFRDKEDYHLEWAIQYLEKAR